MNSPVSVSASAPSVPLTERLQGLRVNGERLWQSLMELARIGATSRGGVCRLALSDLDRQEIGALAEKAVVAQNKGNELEARAVALLEEKIRKES